MEEPKKIRVRMPSVKMKRMAQILIEKPDVSLGTAMQKAGYSVSQSRNPHQITRSRTWQELIDEYLPEDKIATVLAEQLEASEIYVLNGKARQKPDNQARLKAVDISLKLRGNYSPEKTTTFNFSLADLRRMREAGEI